MRINRDSLFMRHGRFVFNNRFLNLLVIVANI